jgi:F0F1-type ATP synthase membrane subunit c/vacuolar-type H+-ATPase subunit K
MNPFRSRTLRTIILTIGGYLLAWALAVLLAPRWPGFCEGTIVAADCEAVAVQSMTGYLVIALGIITMVIVPIVGSLIELAIHGANWETPRGTETATTNVPLLVGLIYLLSGVAIAATA